MDGDREIVAMLEPGEKILWQGQPATGQGRRRAWAALGWFAASLALMVLALAAALYAGRGAGWNLVVLGLVTAAALVFTVGLRRTVLEPWRRRNRDRNTRYAVTDRRAIARTGPYKTAVGLTPDKTVLQEAGTIIVEGEGARVCFERLADAGLVHRLLLDTIGAKK